MNISTNNIEYHDGNRRRIISKAHLESIRSRVRTHEGEFLTDKKGRHYMEKYSKKYLKKDLDGIWRQDKV